MHTWRGTHPPSTAPAPAGECVTYTLIVYIECVYVCIYIAHTQRGTRPPSITPAPTGECVTYALIVYVCIYIVHTQVSIPYLWRLYLQGSAWHTLSYMGVCICVHIHSAHSERYLPPIHCACTRREVCDIHSCSIHRRVSICVHIYTAHSERYPPPIHRACTCREVCDIHFFFFFDIHSFSIHMRVCMYVRIYTIVV